MDIRVLGIDWQNDFVDSIGSLFVKGAEEDATRFSYLIKRIKGKITRIHATLDSHQLVHIAHPIWWVNSDGKHPNPFTIISINDIENGTWRATRPSLQQRSLDYVKSLRDNKGV